jgi:hypothetical protein
VSRSPRELVRTAVGLAFVAPAIGLLVLAVTLMMDGGASGVFAGLFVALLALVLLAGALGMTYAPVSIAKLLEDDEEPASEAGVGTNGNQRPDPRGSEPED